jgi:Flp pilus assembly protein TadD
MVTLNTLGNLYVRQGRAADAERVLTEGRRIDPNNMVTLNTLGNLYVRQGRAADVERVLTEGRRINPRDMATINTLRYLYLNQQRYAEFNRLSATKSEGKGNTVYLSVIAKGGSN